MIQLQPRLRYEGITRQFVQFVPPRVPNWYSWAVKSLPRAILTILGSLLLVSGAIAGGSPASADTGCPTAVAPPQVAGVYQVSSVAHLMWLKEGNTLANVARLSGSYVMTQDIDFTGCVWSSAIADAAGDGNCTGGAGCFAGIFDGAGYRITNFTVTASSSSASLWIGLFGAVVGGTVRDLSVESTISITNTGAAGGVYAGSVIGYVRGNSTINNLTASGTISSSNIYSTYLGGVIGYCSSTGTIANLTAATNLTLSTTAGSSFVYGGGVCAYVDGTISSVSSSGSVAVSGPAGVYAGGVAGNVSGSAVNSSTSVNVSATGTSGGSVYAGGFSGGYYNPAGTVSGSATGTVTVTASSTPTYVGGLLGANQVTVNNSFATGNVTVTSNGSTYVGGLVGNQVKPVTNSYASGAVSLTVTGASSGDSYYVGGLSGYAAEPVTNAYALGNVNLSANAGTGYLGGLVARAMGSITQAYSIGTLTVPTIGTGTLYAGGTTGSTLALGAVFCTYTPDLTCSRAISTADQGSVATLDQLRTFALFADAGWSITNGYSSGTSWGICALANSGYPFITSLQSTNPCATALPEELPPSWNQSIGRGSAESLCPAGWSGSWEYWANGGLGGWVCNREIYYNPQTDRWLSRAT